jgi:hypothetical protein
MSIEGNMAMTGISISKFAFTVIEDQTPGADEPRRIQFEAGEIVPLSYHDLKGRKATERLTIPFVCRNPRVLETNVTDFDFTKANKISMTIETTFASRAISLVNGGWLPVAPFTFDDQTIILIDRNVVSQITGRFKEGVVTASKGEPDFIDLVSDYPIRINPVLCAMEGNVGDTPTP